MFRGVFGLVCGILKIKKNSVHFFLIDDHHCNFQIMNSTNKLTDQNEYHHHHHHYMCVCVWVFLERKFENKVQEKMIQMKSNK